MRTPAGLQRKNPRPRKTLAELSADLLEHLNRVQHCPKCETVAQFKEEKNDTTEIFECIDPECRNIFEVRNIELPPMTTKTNP